MRESQQMKIGDIVRFDTGGVRETKAAMEELTFGRIVGKKTHEDGNGKRVWWQVRWFDEDGRPEAEEMELCAADLIVHEMESSERR